ncbi:MAG TPA: hypothetical protein VI299_08855 [Polyangiales bacterium]
MNALDQLERVRREAVERARLVLREARAEYERCELSRNAARRAEHDAERALASAQRSFSGASSVFDLRAAEGELSLRRSERVHARAALDACERAQMAARATLEHCERALLEAEVGRRAVERRLTQRATDVGRRTERVREDEVEDAFRTLRTR